MSLHWRRVSRLDRVRRDLEALRHVADARIFGLADVGSTAEHARRGVLGRIVHVDHERQGFVIDLDQLERICGDVRSDRGDRGDFLAGETDLAIVERKHCAHSRKILRSRQVYIANARVRPRTAQDRAVKHPGQLDVVSVMGRAGRLQRSVHARRGLADDRQAVAPLPWRRLVLRDDDSDVLRIALKAEVERDAPRHQTSLVTRPGWAALRAAANTCGYVPQRQVLPAVACLISSVVAEGFFSSAAATDITIPGVQKPHCCASVFDERGLHRMHIRRRAESFDRRDLVSARVDRQHHA